MAGRYYAATPIGEGMQNIATAISGLPARQAQAALLAQRQDLVKSQILTDAAHRGVYEEDAAGRRQTRMGRQGMADVLMGSGTSGDGGPDADPQPSPEPVSSPASSMPSITTAFMADRNLGDPISVAPTVAAAPTGPVVPAAPNVAAAVVPQGPRTGWTPDMNRRFYSQAILANEDKAADYARGYMGGSMAATEPNQDKALSYGQAGAGQNWKTTPTGVAAELTETGRNHDMQSTDRQRGQNIASTDRQRGQDIASTDRVRGQDVRANAPGKAGAKGKARELTPTQQSKLVDEVRVEAQKKLGRPLTEAEARATVGAISDEFASGSGYTDAKAIVLDNLVSGDKGDKAPWYKPWGDDKPDTRKLNIPERRAPAAAAPGAAPAPAAASSRAANPRDNDARAVLENELNKAQSRSAEIDTELKNTTYAPRIKELQDEKARLPADIAGIKRELSRVPGGARAPAAAPAPAAAAPAPAAAKASTSVDEWKAKAKAKGWSDKQIADALKSKGF